MANVDQSRVRSGFDVEALLGERYLQMLLATACDAGLIQHDLLAVISQDSRLYEPAPDEDGDSWWEHVDSFQTEILFDHPLGANIRVRAMILVLLGLVDFDLFVKLDPVKEFDEDGALSKVGAAIHVVDIESSVMDSILAALQTTEEELLVDVQEKIDRTVDLGGASKFKKVEDLDIRWHEGDANHPPCLGLYINVRMRNGDPDEDFLPRRGDLIQARNFLPNGEDMAMASRPGMYADMAKHVFSSTAIEIAPGVFEHAFRKSLLNPNSKRIGDLNKVRVMRIPPIVAGGGTAIPQNGLRIQVEGEVIDPIDATNTDVTMTIDLRPSLAADGSLEWKTDFDVDVDAVFEFVTLWTATLLGILFGPMAALYFMGAVFLVEIGVGIGITLYKEGSVQSKADATLADVIPDRLTIATRRWDPFYATLHQVVTKPSQAEFNDAGFRMCGKAFVGRQLVPPLNTYIRDEVRDADGAITGVRYFIADFETVVKDSAEFAPGTSRRTFTPASEEEPELWSLSMAEFDERLKDPEGPLVLANIPYFPACVYIRENQIDQLLCISGSEVEALQNLIRSETSQRGYDRIMNLEGEAITQEVIDDLGSDATQEEIDAEVDKRIRKKLKVVMDKYEPPSPLRLARDGSLQPLMRFDLAPEELVMLQKKKVLMVDNGQLKTIRGRKVLDHIRDIANYGDEEEDDDNLLGRPRYKPTPAGPVFL